MGEIESKGSHYFPGKKKFKVYNQHKNSTKGLQVAQALVKKVNNFARIQN